MSEADRAMTVALEWIAKAENDLKAATHLLKVEDCPTDTVCFHAQQSVEKHIKAMLVVLEKDFRKTHDIGELAALLPVRLRPFLDEKEQDRLTEYATITRYPGDYEPLPLSEARQAVKVARRVRREIRKLLEKKPLF